MLDQLSRAMDTRRIMEHLTLNMPHRVLSLCIHLPQEGGHDRDTVMVATDTVMEVAVPTTWLVQPQATAISMSCHIPSPFLEYDIFSFLFFLRLLLSQS